MAMFWRFGFKPASAIDLLLDREGGATLKEVLDQEEFLQEVKDQNAKLIDFLTKPDTIRAMLRFVMDDIGPNKYASLICEMLSFEIQTLSSAIISQSSLLAEYWNTILGLPPPVDPFVAGVFSKIICILLSRNTAEMISFLKSQENTIKCILKHNSSPAIYDIILKLITLEEVDEGVIAWIASQGLIPTLLAQLDPKLDAETHSCASQSLLDVIAVSYQSSAPPEEFRVISANLLIRQLKTTEMMNILFDFMLGTNTSNMTSSMMYGSNIVIDLIRRYCSEIEQAEYQLHQYQAQMQQSPIPPPTNEKLQEMSHFLNDLLTGIHGHIHSIVALLKVDISPIDSTMGKLVPLGSLRFKVCELLAEILHLQYLLTSSPLFPVIMESFGSPGMSPDTNVAFKLARITDQLASADGLSVCIDIFFKYPWNNFMHSVVYDMVAKVFNLYCFVVTVGLVRLRDPTFTQSETAHLTETAMLAIKESVERLILTAFASGNLPGRIMEAQKVNDAAVQEPKGVRYGHMGHLTYIADEVCKLLEKCEPDLATKIKDNINLEDWTFYVNGILRETKERDRQPLGGYRPEAVLSPQLPMLGGGFGSTGMLDPADTGAIHPRNINKPRDATDDNDDDEVEGPALNRLTGEGFATEGTATSDQLARFLVQQIVSDLPDRFLGTESSDDDEDLFGRSDANPPASWLSEFDSNDIRFDIREAFHPDSIFPDFPDEALSNRREQLDDVEQEADFEGSSLVTPSPIVGDVGFSAQFKAAFEAQARSTSPAPVNSSAFETRDLAAALPALPVEDVSPK